MKYFCQEDYCCFTPFELKLLKNQSVYYHASLSSNIVVIRKKTKLNFKMGFIYMIDVVYVFHHKYNILSMKYRRYYDK